MRPAVFRFLNAGFWLSAMMIPACADSSAPVAKTPSSPARDVHGPSGANPAGPASRPAASDSDDADEDTEELGDPATLEPVVSRGDPMPFGKAKIREKDCWQSVALMGKAQEDYDSLVERCGKPTGAFEYAKPAVGTLDYVRDKRDTFIVHLLGGLCYRFFGVGDATIPKLNILIERNGALQGEARANGPVAIISTDKAWCIDSDAEYRFLVQVGAQGQGRYVFGVWARRPT
jgi:hypothetical protein